MVQQYSVSGLRAGASPVRLGDGVRGLGEDNLCFFSRLSLLLALPVSLPGVQTVQDKLDSQYSHFHGTLESELTFGVEQCSLRRTLSPRPLAYSVSCHATPRLLTSFELISPYCSS